jgi:hypothetical protein
MSLLKSVENKKMVEQKNPPEIREGFFMNVFQLFLHLLNYGLAYSGKRKTTIVEQILHGNHFG